MARFKNPWYQPYRLDWNRTATVATLTVRRWHPAWVWYAVRMVEPRELWRPYVWYAIARVAWKVSH